MPTKNAHNRLDTAVPKPREADRLQEGEKQAMELGEEAEHAHGERRERLQADAKKAADKKSR